MTLPRPRTRTPGGWPRSPRLTLAYLRTELYPGDPAWQAACDALTSSPDPFGRVESR